MRWLAKVSPVLVIGLAIALGVAYTLHSAATLRAGSGDISLAVDPASIDGSAGCQVTVSIVAEGDGLENMAGFQYEVLFDQNVVQVVDDPATAGNVEGIARGANLPTGFFVFGGVDNAAGVATVAGARATSLGGSFTSVRLAEITFDLVGSAGESSAVTLQEALLTDAADPPQEISVGTLSPGAINVQAGDGGADISGNVTLQFRNADTEWLGGEGFSAAKVMAQGPVNRTVPVDPDGSFTVCGAPDGDYTFTAFADGYLSAMTDEGAVEVSGGEDVTVASVQLRGGDVNTSGLVDINDVTATTARFLQGPPTIQFCLDPLGRVVDINCSNLVDINDVTGITSNFLRSSPQPWTP